MRIAAVIAALVGSSLPARADEPDTLTRTLKEILRSPELEGVSVGVHVRSVSDGRTIFERDGSRLLNPASNVKLVTSALALSHLGPAYRFRTLVYRDGSIRNGALQGNLYVKGFGDPTLTSENLFGIINEIALSGIQRLQGSIVVDDTFFDAVTDGPGWDQEASDRSYAPAIGALAVNYGTFTVRVLPGESVGAPARVVLWPDVPSLEVASSVTTRAGGSRSRLWIGTSVRDDGGVLATIRGAVAAGEPLGEEIYRRVNQPGIYAGQTIKRMLELRGVSVEGTIKLAAVPRQNVVLVASHVSEPLGSIVSTLNKHSSNFIAEMILKTVAAELRGSPGTWQKGAELMTEFLVGLGLPAGSFVLENGSGLNDVNRMSPEQLTLLLRAMHRQPEIANEYAASLAVAGSSGTITSRFADSPAEGRLRAKTGSLTGVSALSGYVTTRDDQLLAFSIMMNGYEGRARLMWKVQDRIGAALADAAVAQGPRLGLGPVASPAR
ncbi:MAG: D-alanyl-D-alanine carboxypeptidase/D-alanyl-D-alanine-endopeptidase [Deltaproteobacteria bacterium]|nr:D-alanyl-D-alanine carboxypeptidase/D-alanyl-D-alanine-endopeptidase [Deltaproteobacteria bacterium]